MKVSEQVNAVVRNIKKLLPGLLLSGKDFLILIPGKQSKASFKIVTDVKEVWNAKAGK